MATTIVPPYAGTGWSNFRESYTFPYIWTAYRHKPLSGEIVMQMGTATGASDFQIGILKIGFQHTFKTTFGGTAQILVDVNPGPVTRRGISFCTVEANLKGPGSVDKTVKENVYSYRPLSLLVEANVNSSSTYTLTFYGHMQLTVDGGESAYGEIITGFPKVSRFGAAQGAAESVVEAPEDPRVSALKRPKPVLTRVSLEEAYRAGAEGFEGESAAKEASKPRRRK